MRSYHQGCVALPTPIRRPKGKVDVCSLLDLFVDLLDVILHDRVVQLLGFSAGFHYVVSTGVWIIVGMVRAPATIPLRFINVICLLLPLLHNFLHLGKMLLSALTLI
jgi:hypothetical protein